MGIIAPKKFIVILIIKKSRHRLLKNSIIIEIVATSTTGTLVKRPREYPLKSYNNNKSNSKARKKRSNIKY